MPTLSFQKLSGVKKYLHRRTLIALVILAVLVAGLGSVFRKAPGAGPTENALRSVELKTVSELSAESTPLSVVGTVNSVSEATVRAESSGQATRVYRALGDTVSAGTIIVELEASSQRAALQQAQGALDAAKASLAKVQGGTRPEQLAILQSSLEAAKNGAVTALLSAYAAVDNAVRGGVDSMFSNPYSASPIFNITTTDSQLKVQVQNTRVLLAPLFERETAAAQSLSNSDDLLSEISQTEAEVRTVRDFLDNIVTALNRSVPTNTISASTIATYQASAVSLRASINASLTSLSGARQALQTAQKNVEQGVTGAQQEDVAAAQAAVTQAQGVYAAALANLEKALIRAPISGTINSLSVKRGDYIQQSSPVVTIANNGALEVIAYVTEQDMRDIKPGDTATLEAGATGVVTRVAPAIDPVTKKIEVRIGISGKTNTLVNGQSVTVTFLRHFATATSSSDARITIPISAIKVGTNDASVYTVNADGTLAAHTVVLGELLGDRVVIKEGLTSDMLIVTDARGLRAGQQVLQH